MPKLKRGKRAVCNLTKRELESLVNSFIVITILGANNKITHHNTEKDMMLLKYGLIDF